MTTKTERIFVDTNILVHASVANSSKSPVCNAFLQSQTKLGTELYISGQVIREYIRCMTSPNAGLPREVALKQIREYAGKMKVLAEDAPVHAHLLRLAHNFNVNGKQIHDANIVATMLGYNITRLCTENVKDFLRYGSLISLINPLNP
jgi:predicted nucleic acid-binding protein